MSNPASSGQPHGSQSLNNVLSMLHALTLEVRVRPNHNFIQEMHNNLNNWSKANHGKVYEESVVTKLDGLSRDYFTYQGEEVNDLGQAGGGQKYLDKITPQLGNIGKEVEAITGIKKRQPIQTTTTATTQATTHTHTHTTVYGRGACQACEQQGGGFYSENLPPEERHEERQRQDSPLLRRIGSLDMLAGLGSWSDSEDDSDGRRI